MQMPSEVELVWLMLTSEVAVVARSARRYVMLQHQERHNHCEALQSP